MPLGLAKASLNLAATDFDVLAMVWLYRDFAFLVPMLFHLT